MATAVTMFESEPAGRALLETPAGPVQVLHIPWRDPHTVEPVELEKYVSMLERVCVEHPHNADFRTCLGMAHSMHYDVNGSVDALEQAEEETLKAVNLAAKDRELSLARTQLAEIRRRKHFVSLEARNT